MRSCDRWAASQSRSLPELSDASRTESRARAFSARCAPWTPRTWPAPAAPVPDWRAWITRPGPGEHACSSCSQGDRPNSSATESRRREALRWQGSRRFTADPRRGAAAAEEKKLVPSLGPELSVPRRPHAPGAASGAAQTIPRLGTALALCCRAADILVATAKNLGHPRSPQFGDAAFPQLAQGANLGIEGL